MFRFTRSHMRWQRDLPDIRDHKLDHPLVQKLLEHIKPSGSRRRKLPASVDLRDYFAEVEDQGSLNASSAFAVSALVEYFEARAHGRVVKPSKLFLYQTTLQSQGLTDDSSTGLRSTLKALVRCGTPSEIDWPYHPERLAQTPTGPYLASFGGEHRSMRYMRLDDAEASGGEVLLRVKSYLAAGFPSAFGFAVPNSLSREPDILFRPEIDAPLGGQAVVAVGYDDKKYTHSQDSSAADEAEQPQTGALLIRCPWGTTWGDGGYGWLPYPFVKARAAVDFWTLLKPEWLASGEFSVPRIPDRTTNE